MKELEMQFELDLMEYKMDCKDLFNNYQIQEQLLFLKQELGII